MGKSNWIAARDKTTNSIINVKQSNAFSRSFVDLNGKIYDITDLDFSEKYFYFSSNEKNKEVESGLDGYRAIYG